MTKTLKEFLLAHSSVPRSTYDYLASLEWIRAAENACLIGPPGTGGSHLLIAFGHAAVDSGLRVRYFTVPDLVETLYRGLADNSVGRVIDRLLRADLIITDELGFAPLDHTGAQIFFRFIAASYERRSLGVATHWPFEQWGRYLRRGNDVTLVGMALTSGVCKNAAEQMAQEGIDAEVVDLLSLSPLDEDIVLESVAKTNRVVIVDEDTPRCGMASDIAALVAERAFDYLDAPVKRVTGPHTPVPYSKPLETEFVPDEAAVIGTTKRLLGLA